MREREERDEREEKIKKKLALFFFSSFRKKNATLSPITGVQTDYKLVSSSKGDAAAVAAAGSGEKNQQQAGPLLYYSSSRGLFLSVPAAESGAASASASASASAAALLTASISSPPIVRCAATGAWKRARPITDDGGKSGS